MNQYDMSIDIDIDNNSNSNSNDDCNENVLHIPKNSIPSMIRNKHICCS